MNFVTRICTVQHPLVGLCIKYTTGLPRCISTTAVMTAYQFSNFCIGVTAFSDSSRHLNCVLPLSVFPPVLVQKTFFAGSLSSVLNTYPPHVLFVIKLFFSKFLHHHYYQHPFSVPGQILFLRTVVSAYQIIFSFLFTPCPSHEALR